MRLNQISPNDELTQLVVAEMVKASPLLGLAEFYSIAGNADYLRKSSVATGGAYRALNNDYAANESTPAFANPALKIFGGHVQVDMAHERRGRDIASVRASELLAFSYDAALNFTKEFFKGSISATNFAGLESLVDTDQVLNAGGDNGLEVLAGSGNTERKSQQSFVEKLIALTGMVRGGAQAIAMNHIVWARLTTIAKELCTTAVDDFGNQIRFFASIPVVDPGYDSSGALVLPFDETVGTSTTCTSVYAMRFGEGRDVTIASNIGLDVRDLGVVGVHYTHKCELDAAVVIQNDRAVARLKGVIIP